MNILFYNPISSIISYSIFKIRNEITFPDKDIGKNINYKGKGEYQIFLSMLMGKEKNLRKGKVIFQIFFRTPNISTDDFIYRTKSFLPFFSGLPGFCFKHFMFGVNKEERKFSGYYEWEDFQSAKNYSNSYSCWYMQRLSNPYPINYRIIDKENGKILYTKE